MDVPDAARLDAAMKQAQLEAAFWDRREADLQEEYPEHFVAVYDSQVVAAAPHLQDVLEQLQRQGLDARRTWLRYMTANPYRFVL